MKRKGILFDCDGVLLDSESIYLHSLCDYLHSIGIPAQNEDVVSVSNECDSLLAQSFIQYGAEQIGENRGTYSTLWNSATARLKLSLPHVACLQDSVDQLQGGLIRFQFRSDRLKQYVMVDGVEVFRQIHLQCPLVSFSEFSPGCIGCL